MIIKYIKDQSSYNKSILGYIIFLIHNIFIFSLATYLFMGEINRFYYIGIFTWSLIMIMQFYNNGCILLNIERYLFENKNYGGIWEHVLPLFISKTDENKKQKKKNIIRTVGSLFYLIVFLRVIFN